METAACLNQEVDRAFSLWLNEYGLVDICIVNDEDLIEKVEVARLEKIMQMHFGLHINLKGIDVINNLLEQIEELKNKVRILNNRLR